jgi:hypothetical protein
MRWSARTSIALSSLVAEFDVRPVVGLVGSPVPRSDLASWGASLRTGHPRGGRGDQVAGRE